jgi:hypothetical protein
MLASGQVVSYVGFVSDSFEPEVFVSNYVDIMGQVQSSRYRDCLPPGAQLVEDEYNKLEERNVYYLVPIPGETRWIRESRLQQENEQHQAAAAATTTMGNNNTPITQHNNNNNNKRSFEDTMMMELSSQKNPFQTPNGNNSMDNSSISTCIESSSRRMKRSHDSNTNTNDELTTNNNNNNISPPKCTHEQSQHVQSLQAQLDELENFPIPGELECPCVLKTYSEHISLNLHDVVRVVGILCIDPDLYSTTGDNNNNYMQMDSHDDFFLENGSHHIPSSIAPRLHALSIEKLHGAHPVLIPPILYRPIISFTQNTNNNQQQQLMIMAREYIIKLFTRIWNGDRLLAEYLLLWCISGISARANDITLVGKLSLCVLGTLPHMAKWMQELLTMLCPRINLIPLTQPLLTSKKFSPNKSPQDLRVHAGRLQMAPGTRCVIDETVLMEGVRLNEIGMDNIRALQQLAQRQTVTYEFPFYPREFPVDTPCLILSSNQNSSLIPGDVSILYSNSNNNVVMEEENPMMMAVPSSPFQISNNNNNNTSNNAQDQYMLSLARQYLEEARLRVISTVSLSDEAANAIQQDFVQTRARGEKVDQDDLHIWINTARAIASSFGRSGVDVESYGRARSMDIERRKRGMMSSATGAITTTTVSNNL